MSTHARPLAVWLADADDAQLSALFAARGVHADVPWADFFDAAEALLDPAALQRFLPSLPRRLAIVVHRAAAGEDIDATDRDALRTLALLRPDGTLSPPIAAAVIERARPTDATSSEPLAAAGGPAAARAAERVLTTVSAIADLLITARELPFGLLASGLLSAGERKRAVEAGVPLDDIDTLVRIARDAGILVADDRLLREGTPGTDWLVRPGAERWEQLALAFRAALPSGLRDERGGWIPLSDWPAAYPWDPTWPGSARAQHEQAVLLGLVADEATEPAWAAGLRSGGPADVAALRALLPAEVDRIFLQNDLSAIAPGPLAPALDVRLRSLARRESTAQASSYRFSADSLARGFAGGETEESILAFLGALSLTGIPQPLSYLIDQTARRHDLVHVHGDILRGCTTVSSSDPHLIEAILVDQTLRPLRLQPAGSGTALSLLGRDPVYWALIDARYPAVIVDDEGAPLTAGSHHPVAPAREHAMSDYGPLIARLRSVQGPDADASWLERELSAAVRAKALIEVEVGLPNGSSRTFLLEARGFGGGRVRGLDRGADVERTLPLSSISSVSVRDSAAPDSAAQR